MLPVKSVNFVVLGKQELAVEFGKKGTQTDITLYDRKEAEVIKTWVVPNGFPEKIQPLFQAINLAEYVIFYVNSLDKFTGEQIVALDSLDKKKGIITHSYDVDETRLYSMIKGTVLENYTKVQQDKIREEVDKIQPIQNEGFPQIVVDHCFDVKGVGTVILGKVTSGKIKQYDNLKIYPVGADIMIKSIQMHDDPVEEATYPARVGLAIKGVKPEEVGRGDIICQEGKTDVVIEIKLDFKKSPFYKGDVSINQMCLVSVGMQVKAAKFSSIDPVMITFDKAVACNKGDIAVILKPESSSIRIMGKGIIK